MGNSLPLRDIRPRWLPGTAPTPHQPAESSQRPGPRCPGLPLLRTPGAVQASLEFGGSVPSPSARDVLWTLYRNVKASGQTLAALRVEESSLTCDQSSLSDLAPETVSISAIATSPFPPQLLLPASAPLVLLGEQILREVTPLVSGFYKARPQDDPLLIFRWGTPSRPPASSPREARTQTHVGGTGAPAGRLQERPGNLRQYGICLPPRPWCSRRDTAQGLVVHIEYKFQQALPAQLRGLATHLARNIVASILQKSSIVANGEKAELVRYEVWLRIQGPLASQATEDKTSSESGELQARLTRWLTAVLRPLQNLDRVVVEELQPDPLTARLGVTFFGEAPAPERVQDLVHQSLPALRATEGLSAEMVLPGPGIPGAEAQPGTPVPSYAVALLALSLLLATPTLVLVLKGRVCPGVFGLRDGKCRRGASGTSDRKHLPLSLANHKKAPRTVDQPEAAHRSAPPPATRPTARRAPLKPAPRALRGGPAPGLLQATPERPDVNLEPGRVWHQPEAATQHGAASRLDSGAGTAPAGSRALGTD
nr:taste receptor cell protein 1 [Oryctolagus cuniculus]